jgi:hypothetical protein
MANEPEETIEGAEVEADPNRLTHKATFVAGRVYILGNRRFEKGKPALETQYVTASEAEFLSAAQDIRVIVNADETQTNVPQKKFKIEKLSESEEKKVNVGAKKPQAPRRQRA